MSQVKPLASLSFDLDNKWSYLKTHGDRQWESYPSYIPVLIPQVLEMLRQKKLGITFFIVGQDAARPENRDYLQEIVNGGHETGNHSYNHEPWLHLYSHEAVVRELSRADAILERACGSKPIGYRGPGFNFSKKTLEVLSGLGYQYDASLLPSFLGPVARLYYLWSAGNLTSEERKKREALFGAWGLGLKPNKPFNWQLETGAILEIPVTTMPVLRVPIHLSYVIYLAGFSYCLARAYARSSLALCRLAGVEPSFLLHPLDFLGGETLPELRFFPGMNLSREYKRRVVNMVLAYLQKHFEILPMGQYAARLKNRQLPTLPVSS